MVNTDVRDKMRAERARQVACQKMVSKKSTDAYWRGVGHGVKALLAIGLLLLIAMRWANEPSISEKKANAPFAGER